MPRLAWCLIAIGLLLQPVSGTLNPVAAQADRPVVYVVPVTGIIDLGLAPFLSRTIREAQDAGAAAVVLDINTFGGRVDAAVAMRDALLGSPVKTIAFVNQRAISAGALITLACEQVVMATGGTVGAATPVLSGGTETVAADEKTVSYVRSEFRATAEARNRNPQIAEAMVDPDVVIPGLIEAEKLLTLTTSQAIEHGIADYTADSLEAALEAVGLAGADVFRAEQTWAESVVRFITNPVVSSLLMTLGLLGLLVEIRTPGFGVPGGIGVLSIALFFWGHWIVQLAGWEELLLVFVGVLLLLVEVFLLPGFTLAGVAGIVMLVAGLGLTLVGSGATAAAVISALGRVAISVLVALAGGLVAMRFLPKLPFGRRLILSTDMEAEEGFVSSPETDRQWLGKTGRAVSPLSSSTPVPPSE
jgi:membrane-bound serine protease (ClpP class)